MTTNAWRRLAGALAIVGLLAAPQQPVGAQEVDDLSSLPIEGRDLAVGSESPGELTDADVVWTDDSYVQAWALELERGATVTVDLLSDDFDAYLMVTGPGIAGTLYDDDGAGACNARVTLTASQDGTYRVVVNTISPGSMGRFRLRVTDEPGPVTAGECDIFGEGLDEIEDLDQLLALPLGGEIWPTETTSGGTGATPRRGGSSSSSGRKPPWISAPTTSTPTYSSSGQVWTHPCRMTTAREGATPASRLPLGSPAYTGSSSTRCPKVRQAVSGSARRRSRVR